MPTKCFNCPLRRKSIFSPMTDDEVAFMSRFKTGELTVDPGTQLLMDGSNSPQLYTALSGMGVRYKTLLDGRRQVVSFVFPGDLIGMQAGIMGEMKHSVEATTAMTLCVFSRSDVWNLFKTHPSRAFDMTWLAAVEENFLGDALATIGQRTAIERISWAMVKMFRRAEALEMTDGQFMPLPYRQQDLADALGLSLVHTNKTLGKLRERQLASWADRKLHLMDIDALARIAQIEHEEPEMRPLM
ncbi:Crp/Fnr family transcriptional regulator [Oceaniovalibus sp. ACAM 378]|uniref:Crp/Fnr family transcriptional regulator n=1 Tax=Oceaniovalibus sp. ACAM 378 TaxID=2599923 RepID=UPI0011DB9C2F|nr:Crp/Fnr family transcriptional regulator [Oceaniovalibus sp. ACAM 378]TYB89252.1 Crp/Fnr family transcriptional regulator [Oceaniovalibus sp. ACAM 378]